MQNFLVTLLACSVTMSVLALLYMAAMPLLAKRYSGGGRYYTWLVFVIGLIIPFRPQFSSPIVQVDLPGSVAGPMTRMGNVGPVIVPAVSPLAAAVPILSWWQIAGAVWLVGLLLFLTFHIVKHVRFLKLAARWCEPITDESTLTLFQSIKTQMGLSQPIDLQVCGSVGSPMLVGFLHPQILLSNGDFAEEELHFILKHELVHYKRKDLWYKSLVLLATAIHWFNPVVYWMAKAIDMQCEISCDEEVVQGTGVDTRLQYSETIVGVIRTQSQRKTALSTHFYGGKKGMKQRIFSIMDLGKKRAGTAILCGALVLTLGTGFTFAATAKTQTPSVGAEDTGVQTPWDLIVMTPNPEVYAPYTAFGLTISEDGTKLLYQGQAVRLFADEKSDTETFYINGAGELNLSAVRDAVGQLTGIQRISAEQAEEYYKAFFAEERTSGYFTQVYNETDTARVMERVPGDRNKYEKYQPLGITYSAADEILSYNGQRVKFLLDQTTAGDADTLWLDDAGTVNLVVIRDEAGQMTGLQTISDEKAKEYEALAIDTAPADMGDLERRVEARIRALYPEN